MLTTVFVALVAVVAGSFPSGVVLGRIVTGRDVRDFGSGNIGAANSARVGGFKVGAGVALLDVLKGVLPVLLGRLLGLEPTELAVVALAAVCGHDFSIFLHFQGGKGVATTLGVGLALAPIGTMIAALLWLAVLLRSRYSSLASLIALAVLPLAVAFTGSPPAYATLGFGLFILAAIKHRGNIGRLLSGRESRFGDRHADGT